MRHRSGVHQAEAEHMRDVVAGAVRHPIFGFQTLRVARPDDDVLHVTPRYVPVRLQHQRDEAGSHRGRRRRAGVLRRAGAVQICGDLEVIRVCIYSIMNVTHQCAFIQLLPVARGSTESIYSQYGTQSL